MTPKLSFERKKAKLKEWDNQLTPLEIATALEADAERPFAIAPLLRSGERPVDYARNDWSEDASYYTSRKGAKRLIVVFTGLRGRPGVPVSYFLQMQRDEEFDVIVLRDTRHLHYTHGVQGLGGFVETIKRIRDFSDANGFQEIITYGNSMGGFPALRAGRLLGARRAISIGGRPAWHPGRLVRGDTPVYAFDPLCRCTPANTTELVAVYARHNEFDKKGYDLLKRMAPACTGVPIDIKGHAVVGYFYETHLLHLFMSFLFDFWDDVERSTMLVRLENAARHALLQQSLSEQRSLKREQDALRSAKRQQRKTKQKMKRKLDHVYESYSWRATSPFRALRRMLLRQH